MPATPLRPVAFGLRMFPVDDSAFGQVVAAESGRLARLGTLLTGDRQRGRELAEVALARAMLRWRRLYEEEPAGALRRVLFEVHGEWWRRRYRRYGPAATGPDRREPTPAGARNAAAGRAGGGGTGPVAGPAPGAVPDPAAPGAARLAAMTPRERAVALLDAEGRSEAEMVGLLGLSDRAVARSRPAVPMPELTAALSVLEPPVPVDVVADQAARLRRRRRVTAGVVAVLVVVAAIATLRALTSDPGPAEAARACPTRLPAAVSNSGPDLDVSIVPFSPTRLYLCRFAPDGSRSDARRLGSRAGVVFVAALNTARPTGDAEVCSREEVTPFVLRVFGREQEVTLLADPSGCGRVSNGVRTVSAGRDLLAHVLNGQPSQDPEPALQSCAGLGGNVHNDGGALDQRLVGFTGDRIVVCPHGVQATVGELAGQSAQELSVALDRAPVRRKATTGCPSAKRLIVVVTGQNQRVDIAMDASGCGWASNGLRVVQLDRPTENLLRELAQLPPL
jgi:DNA-directed RNA polymerase specialized sigma24 family protein